MNSFGVSGTSSAILEKIDQNLDDLIYNISIMPSWIVVPYIKGGLYDRIKNNAKEYADLPLLLEQDEYIWYRQPCRYINISATYKVNLCTPNSTYDSLTMREFYDKTDKDVLTLDLVLYKSGAYDNIQAVTYLNRNIAIKPFKVFKHVWERSFHPIKNGRYVEPEGLEYRCKNCGLLGIKQSFTSNHLSVEGAIIPDKLLTCDQKIIEDIIV